MMFSNHSWSASYLFFRIEEVMFRRKLSRMVTQNLERRYVMAKCCLWWEKKEEKEHEAGNKKVECQQKTNKGILVKKMFTKFGSHFSII